MRTTLAEIEPQEVADYEFKTLEGTVRLSELFGDHEGLIVVHNMGPPCPGCTLWADGYNGMYHHVVTRTAFAVSSPDTPAAQRKIDWLNSLHYSGPARLARRAIAMRAAR